MSNHDSAAINRIELSNEDVPSKRASEFTSENFKMEISNLPCKSKYHLVRHMIEKNFKLQPHKIRVGNGRAYLAFLSEKERDEAIAKINNQDHKGKVLVARPASPRHDPFQKRLKTCTNSGQDDLCNQIEPEEVTDRDVILKVCPLFNKTYEEQLRFKEESMKSVLIIAPQLKKLCPSMKSDCPLLHRWTEIFPKICCKFEGVLASPVLSGYRNKCEFNIGSDGTVGFRVGSYKRGSERVIFPPLDCPIVSERMFEVIKKFQTYLSEETKLKGFDHITHEGNFRQLTIRSNQVSECLLIFDIHPQDLNSDQQSEEIERIVNLYRTDTKIVSINFNISEKGHLADLDQTLRLVHGKPYLQEYLHVDPDSPLRFRIGPSSFFQVNTKAAELLYRSLIELAQLDRRSLVLDVGCGTGTIALSLAKQVSYVIGIEVVKAAVDDAKNNANENSVKNVSFFCGRAEDLIKETLLILRRKLSDQDGGEIVAIMDPPRTGFNSSFIKTIRASNIKKIIYVACDPKANENLVSLCRPTSKAYQGEPFVPVRAQAFDLFPHTKFCELVLVYERLSKNYLDLPSECVDPPEHITLDPSQ